MQRKPLQMMANTGGTIPLRASGRGVMMVAKGFVLNLSSKVRAHAGKLVSSSMTWAMDSLYPRECALILSPRDNARKEMIVATSIPSKKMGLETRPYLQALALTFSGRDSVKGDLNAGNMVGFD